MGKINLSLALRLPLSLLTPFYSPILKPPYAFTDSVKKAREQYGSRENYARMEQSGDRFQLTNLEVEFIQSRDSFYLATVGENGWPYVQHITPRFTIEEIREILADRGPEFLEAL